MISVQLEFFLLGLTMSIAGAALFLGRRSHLARAYSRLVSRGGVAADWALIQGTLLLIGGGALLLLSGISFLTQLDPGRSAEAQATLSQAAAQPAPPGESLSEAAVAARMRDASTPVEVRSIAFTARGEFPVCGASLSVCASDNPDRPVQRWDGQLTWDERRAGAGWQARGCRATATVSARGAWDVSINYNLCDRPATP